MYFKWLAFYLIFLWTLIYMFGFILLSSLQYFISLDELVTWSRAFCSLWVHLVYIFYFILVIRLTELFVFDYLFCLFTICAVALYLFVVPPPSTSGTSSYWVTLNKQRYCVNTTYLVDRCICPAPCRSRQTLEKNVLSWALAGTGSVLFTRQVAVQPTCRYTAHACACALPLFVWRHFKKVVKRFTKRRFTF